MAYELSYRERLKVGWLVAWRGMLIGIVAGIPGGIIWGIIAVLTDTPESLSAMVNVGLGIPIGVFIVSPLVVKMMLNKQFSTFTLQAVFHPRTDSIIYDWNL